MMDCTDRHERYFLRLFSKNVMLYSEMVATKSAIHGDREKILGFSASRTWSPKKYGINDERVLGVAISEIKSADI